MKYMTKTAHVLRLFIAAGCIFFLPMAANASLSIRGDVKTPLDLSVDEIKAMPEFHINAVAILKEKSNKAGEEQLIGVDNYGGVLLRDLLEKAGMKYIRKWEPAVFIRVKGDNGKEVVFSFGEIFYSSIGRSILVAYRKNGRMIEDSKNPLALIVANDIRDGRRIQAITEVIVERVDIEMKVYDERKKHIVQPPTTHLQLTDIKTNQSKKIAMEDLMDLPKIYVWDKVQVGDCEGFHGVYSYEGVTLRSLLEKEAFVEFPYDYNRFVVIYSENGFCATYSIGELFNSRLGNNIILAYKKDGKPLGPDEAFGMMVAVEDNTGGRSVKRIAHISIY